MIFPAQHATIIKCIRRALEEDFGHAGDVSSQLTISLQKKAHGVIRVHDDCLLSGLDVAKKTFLEVDSSLCWHGNFLDGDSCSSGVVASVEGSALSILAAERVALNFLAHLSGIATKTKQFSTIAQQYGTFITATRKTTPMLRMFEKQAVIHGGGMPHRYGLYDGILLKDNHLSLVKNIAETIKKIRSQSNCFLQIEVDHFAQIKDVIKSKPDGILLDNMTPEQSRDAIAFVRKHDPRIWCEISGGITLDNLPMFARSKPDVISTSVITQKASAINVSLDFTY